MNCVHADDGQPWRLSVTLPDGLQLNDDSGMSLNPLRAQLSRLKVGQTFFRDPFLLSGKVPSASARLQVFGENASPSLSWKNSSRIRGTLEVWFLW